MSQRTLIITLVTLMLLFGASTYVGSRPDRDGAVDIFDSNWASTLRTRFSTRVSLDAIELNHAASPDGCVLEETQITIPSSVLLPCRFDIAAAAAANSDSVRTMTLHFAEGAPDGLLAVRLEQPNTDKALTVNKQLTFGQQIDLEIYEGAARLKIDRCQSAHTETVTCTIKLTVAD